LDDVTFRLPAHLKKQICIRLLPKKEPNMKKNMGTLDRILRLIVAAVFAYLYFSGTVTGALGIILLVLGAVFVLTSLVSFCPLYLPFKISTRKS
jgi:hypothetical protein